MTLKEAQAKHIELMAELERVERVLYAHSDESEAEETSTGVEIFRYES